MARRSRAPVQFDIASLLERTQTVVAELQHHCRHGSVSNDRILRYRMQLTRALRDVDASHISTLVGNESYLNIVSGIRQILAVLESVDSTSQESSYSVVMDRHEGRHTCTFMYFLLLNLQQL